MLGADIREFDQELSELRCSDGNQDDEDPDAAGAIHAITPLNVC